MLTSAIRRRLAASAALALLTPLAGAAVTGPAQAASSDGCRGGGFSVVDLVTGAVVVQGEEVEATIPAGSVGSGRLGVRGRYVQYDVRPSDFAVLDYAFTGAANELDMTGGRFTPVFASKTPDLRGLRLSGAITVELDEEEIELQRAGTGVSVKIQSKDCAQGGIFQMEPEREDRTDTRITHVLATATDPAVTPFYFDNPFFRARAGQFLGSACTSETTGPPSRFCVQVSPRVNIGNDASPRFVARDSAQVATRVAQPGCNTADGPTPSVEHCGAVSVWDVASGGRMGFVTGEDAVEVANPPTECVTDCQAQNQVRGRLTVLGFPFPVPVGSRLVPAAPLVTAAPPTP